MLSKVQRGLERLYRIETDLKIDDFRIDSEVRARMGVARLPREQLLLTQNEDGLSIGLFVDDAVLENLEGCDPTAALCDENLGDFLLVVEGVSHFVYVAWRAQRDQPVSGLELELQAEVDKYVTCLLISLGAQGDPPAPPSDRGTDGARPRSLHRRLFIDVDFEDDLDDEEQDRYRAANANALRYSRSLDKRYVRTRRISDMLAELRYFYRLPLRGKLEHIQAA